MNRRQRQPGFALLMVLVLVMLAAVALAGLARRSFVAAVDTHEAVESLQRRWAVRSCRAAFLNRIETLLDEKERGLNEDGEVSEKYLNKPIPELRINTQLAGVDYQIILTDEQARVNLTDLLREWGAENLRPAFSSLGVRLEGLDREVRLDPRPLVPPEGMSQGGVMLPDIRSYGQVFAPFLPGPLLDDDYESSRLARITCWGDGKVSLRRAPDKVVRWACAQVLGEGMVQTLLSARRDNRYVKLSELLKGEDRIDADEREMVKAQITDVSSCHGLWVIARTPQRSWYDFTVSGVEDRLVPGEKEGAWRTEPERRTFHYQW